MNEEDEYRDRAADVVDPHTPGMYGPQWDELVDAVAAALAEEREKARAQFCALLAASPTLVDSDDNPRGYLVSLPLLSTLGITASDIDRAAEETTE